MKTPTRLALAAAALGLACVGALSATGATTAHHSATTRTSSSAPSAWPGQLQVRHQQPVPLRENGVELTVADGTEPAQARAAYAALRAALAALGPGVLDPGGRLAPADLQQLAAPYLSPSASAALATLAPGALEGDPGARNQLLPLLFWYDVRSQPGAELRPAAAPFTTQTLTSAAARTVRAGQREALMLTVGTELDARLVDPAGAGNELFLVRTLSVAMVPARGGWVIDGWSGQWQSVKPSGQQLPRQSEDAPGFSPR